MASVKENLIAAKALIDTPEKWGKGEYNLRHGCYCALGAVMAVHGNDDDYFVCAEDKALARALPDGYNIKVASAVAVFNDDDETTHADIMALFDRAIEAAE